MTGDINFNTLIKGTLMRHSRFQRAVDAIHTQFKSYDGIHSPRHVMVLGESGTGKSTLLEYIKTQYPAHRSENGVTRSFATVELVEAPGKKALPGWCLDALEDALPFHGEQYKLTWRLIGKLGTQQVRVMAVDEGQHMVEQATGRTLREAANFFKMVSDRTKIGLVFVGLPSLNLLRMADPQLRERTGSPILLPRFNYENLADRSEFRAILQGFHHVLSEHFELPDFTNEAMVWHWYGACGGLMRPLVNTLVAMTEVAEEAGARKISPELLLEASRRTVGDDEFPENFARPFAANYSLIPNAAMVQELMKVGMDRTQPVEGVTKRPMGRGRRKASPANDDVGEVAA